MKCGVKTNSGKSCQNCRSSGLETCWVHSDVCSICIAPIKKSEEHRASCDHRFHRHCIETWREKSCRCPMCREIVFRPVVVTVRIDPVYFSHPGICDFFVSKLNRQELVVDKYEVFEEDGEFFVHDFYSRELVGTVKKEALRVLNAVPTR